MTISTEVFSAWDFINANIGPAFRSESISYNTTPRTLNPTKGHHNRKFNAYLVKGDVDIHLGNIFLITAEADYGWITHGNSYFELDDVTDTGQYLSTRDIITGHVHGHAYDYSAGAGLQASYFQDTISGGILGGYAYNYTDVSIKDFNDQINNDNLSLSPKIHSYYKSNFRGPWVGIFTSVKPISFWIVNFAYAYHFLTYHSDVTDNFFIGGRRYNLRSQSFFGNEVKFSTIIKLKCNFELGVDLDCKFYQGKKAKLTIDRSLIDRDTVRKAYHFKFIQYTGCVKIGYYY
jgi:hypothetical protein